MKTFFAYAGIPLGVFVLVPLVLGVGAGALAGDLAALAPLLGLIAGIGAAAALAAALIAFVAHLALRFIFARLRAITMPRGSKVLLSALSTAIVLVPLWPFALLMLIALTGASFS